MAQLTSYVHQHDQEQGDAMHARMLSIEVEPKEIDDAIAQYRDQVVPLMRQRAKSVLVLADRTRGKSVVVSLWEKQTDPMAVESTPAYRRAVSQFAAEFFAAPPTIEEFEIVIQG